MTVTRTFSIRKELAEALDNEARTRGISSSALINQTIDRSVRQVWPSEKTGVIVIGHHVIKDLLDYVLPEDVRKVATSAAQRHRTRASVLYGTEPRLESVLEMMDKIIGPYFGWFMFTHSVKGGDHRVLLNHLMGKGWSIWLEAFFTSFFMEMLDIPVKSSYIESMVVLEFKV